MKGLSKKRSIALKQLLVVLLAAFSFEDVAQSAVEFACGTAGMGGSFYAETGAQYCSDQKKELTPDSAQIFCFYQATCMPLTSDLKAFILKTQAEKRWEDLSDDQINHTLIQASMMAQLPTNPDGSSIEVSTTAIQCLGTKKSDGSPNCPKVNACINNRQDRAVFWKMKPLEVFNPAIGLRNSKSFRMEQEGNKTPRGTSR